MSAGPNLFLIGGMKCGSTTLYDDLARHPDIYNPPSKEPSFLQFEDLNEDQIRKKYIQLFQRGEITRYRMDGSTRYSMRTELSNVPQRLHQMFGSDVKIIYMVRNPIDRMKSHYRHLVSVGRCSTTMSELLQVDNRLVDHSRYAWQLEPWLQTFERENVFALNFEAFVSDRKQALTAVFEFLGLEVPPEYSFSDEAKNASSGKVIPKGWISPLSNNFFLKTKIEPLLPRWIPRVLKKITHRSAPVATCDLPDDVLRTLAETLEPDVQQMSRLCDYPSLKQGERLWEINS